MTKHIPFDHDRFPVRPMTKQAAQDMGHVAWIEETDPIRAISKMYNALASGGYNCALWPNAGLQMPAADKAIIREWRKHHGLSIGAAFGHASVKDIAEVLTDKFNWAKGKNLGGGDNAAFDALQRHGKTRLEQIAAAIPARHYELNLRGGEKTTGILDAHVDGDGYGTLRFLESIESPGTCIIDNRDVKKGREYSLRDHKTITFWQIPEGSLCLIGNREREGMAAMHSAPPTPKGSKPIPRTLFVFDIRE